MFSITFCFWNWLSDGRLEMVCFLPVFVAAVVGAIFSTVLENLYSNSFPWKHLASSNHWLQSPVDPHFLRLQPIVSELSTAIAKNLSGHCWHWACFQVLSLIQVFYVWHWWMLLWLFPPLHCHSLDVCTGRDFSCSIVLFTVFLRVLYQEGRFSPAEASSVFESFCELLWVWKLGSLKSSSLSDAYQCCWD